VLFNPTEYTLERSNAYKTTTVPGLGGPLIHFVNGEADALTMELFLDDYTDRPSGGGKSVRELLDDLGNLLEVQSDLHAPPVVRFVWGKLSFKAILEKMSRKLTLFRPDGSPARASVSVSFKEYRTLSERLREPRLESPDKSKRRVIVGRDTLWLLASREYGDPALWRVIAAANDLDDPRDIRPGDWVTLPPLESDHGTGRSR
jgi:nucleoid-associated protein YgaU